MSCSRFRERWHAGADDTHAEACPGCAAWLSGQRLASSALSRLAEALDEEGGRDREIELRAAFRRQAAVRAEPHGAAWPWGFAAAAVVALVASTLGLRVPEPAAGPVPGPKLAVSTPDPAPRAAAHAVDGRDGEIGRRVRAERGAARQDAVRRPAPRSAPPVRQSEPAPREPDSAQVSVPVSPAAAAEIAAAALAAASVVLEVQSTVDDAAHAADPAPGVSAEGPRPMEAPARRAAGDDRRFYPLGADDPAVRADDDRIVRVQLRVDVLDAAGVKREGTASGPVEAEVLVGRDGVARGVRLARPRP